ncbi:streptophobe family protein [Streptacidiphilus rugosus]|uniref:streptophobe family protein n=1 Tax=Streptacidiphilus rugosus TaxID=405783 RepID=UPI00068BA9A4|nr:streptophobe family protein [Streptacidiphilus rugosus]
MQAGDRHTGTASLPARSLGAAAVLVLGALAVMAALGALGLWLAGADALPGDSFGPVLAATMLMALGAPVTVAGTAGGLAQANAALEVLPLTLSLAGALVVGLAFLRPLRHRAVAHTGELLARLAAAALLWAVAVWLLALTARHSFVISTGSSLTDQIGSALGASPTVGFRVGVGPAIGFGLLWLLVVLALTFLVSRSAPLPPRLLRFQDAVRPAGSAVLAVLLGYVLVALVAGLVTAVVHGPARDVLAVVVLALPNVAWLAFGVGLGGSWHGHLNAGIGLPMPKVLSAALRAAGAGTHDTTVDLATLAQRDGRVWLLPVLAGLALLGCGVALGAGGVRRASEGGTSPLWRHAVSLGVATACAMLLVGLLTRVSAAYGLSLFGVGGTGGLSDLLGDLTGGGSGGSGGSGGQNSLAAGAVSLVPDLARGVLLGALWGALAGAAGGWLGARLWRGRYVVGGAGSVGSAPGE